MRRHALSATLLLAVLASTPWTLAEQAQAPPERIVERDGLIYARPVPVPEHLNNPWPADWERDFWQRANAAIRLIGNQRPAGGTWGENEKNYYPRAMFNFLAGNREVALRALQEEDVQRDNHAHTLGMDLYWTFTLKGQMRKYFYFGQYLAPEYVTRMREAGRIWTERDPTTREHPIHGRGSGEPGYGPEQRGFWVDRRGTDNMRIMRDGSIFLMAEETGNAETAEIARQRLIDYVRMLYHVGMKEWDSPNYHGHTMAPFHNVYDFARDESAQAVAKAGLDFLNAAAALKYWRGGFGGGAMARHHGGGSYEVFAASPVHPLYLYAGDTVGPNPRHDRDDVHHITSAYRPPAAVVELARRNFPRPVEIFSTKPAYTNWRPGQEFRPRFWETIYIGRTFQMGSAVSERFEQVWAIAPFSLMTLNSERGVDYFVARSDPMPGNSRKNPGDQIAQYRNLMIWLRPASEAHGAMFFMTPDSARWRQEEGVWFVEYEQAWLAIRPIGLEDPQDAPHDRERRYAADRFHRAAGPGRGCSASPWRSASRASTRASTPSDRRCWRRARWT